MLLAVSLSPSLFFPSSPSLPFHSLIDRLKLNIKKEDREREGGRKEGGKMCKGGGGALNFSVDVIRPYGT